MYLGARLAETGSLYNTNESSGFRYSKSQLENTFSYLRKNSDNAFKKGLEAWFTQHEKPIECYALFSTIYLDSYGNIHTCNKKGPVVSLKGKDPLKAWKSLKKERSKIRNCKECYTDCQLIPDLILEGSALKVR